MGLWFGQLYLCLACHLDHRYLREADIATFYFPADGVDPARRRILLLDSRRK